MKKAKPIIAMILIFVIALILSLTIGLALTGFAHGAKDLSLEFYMAHPWPGFVVAMLVEGLFMWFGYIWWKKKFAKTGDDLPAKFAVRESLIGFAIGAGAVAVGIFILWLMGVYQPRGLSLNTGLLVGFAAGFGAAVTEEIFFRGFILCGLVNRNARKKHGVLSAIVLTSIIFGLCHFPNDLDWLEVVSVILSAGLLLNAVWFLTRRLWINIGAHFGWNFAVAGIFGLTISGVASDGGLIRADLRGSELLTGGVSGVETSVVLMIVATVAALIIFAICWKKGLLKSKEDKS